MKKRPDLNNLSKEVALSVKQPWAYLLCAGIKPIENRTWALPEKYIGKRVYIHASKSQYKSPWDVLSKYQNEYLMNIQVIITGASLEYGAIIGYVEFSECVINHPSIWAEKTPDYVVGINPKIHEQITGNKIIYNWLVSKAVLFDKPIFDVKGKLSFWDCSDVIYNDYDDYDLDYLDGKQLGYKD